MAAMLSWTTPTLSKMPASVHMNQPETFISRMMRPVTTAIAPIETCSALQSHRASAVVTTRMVPFSVNNTSSMVVFSRNWA